MKMDEKTKQEVDKYIELFEEINLRTANEELSCRIVSELARDRRQRVIVEEKQNGNSNGRSHDNRPATERQIKALERMNISFWEDMTLQEASALIKSGMLMQDQGQNGIQKAFPIMQRTP